MIVEAIGSACASRDKERSEHITAAMESAVIEAFAAGVTDPDEIRARKLAARERVKNEAPNP